MASIVFDKAQVMAAVDAIAEQTMRMDMMWDWPCGVAYLGICEAYRVTGNREYLDLLKARVDEYIELGLPSWTVNTCAMGHAMLTLYEVTGDEKYKDIALSKLDYLRHEALRFGDNVLQHTVSDKNDFPEQCWADTLFMAAYFMLRAGVMFGDGALVDDALNQYYWHRATPRSKKGRSSPSRSTSTPVRSIRTASRPKWAPRQSASSSARSTSRRSCAISRSRWRTPAPSRTARRSPSA